MELDKPHLSSIFQVFSIETLIELEKEGYAKTFGINWGPDREVTLKNRDTSIKNQWNGTCTSFATIAAIENKLGGQTELSERSLWDFYGVYSTEEAIKSAQNFYILEEKYWPQHEPRFDTRFKGKGRFKIMNYTYLGRDYIRVINAIDNGNPCVVALSTPKDLYNGKVQVEANSSFIRKSGHAMCVSGYKIEGGKAYFQVKNSWGINHGNKGYQYVAFDLFNGNGYALFYEIRDIHDRGEQQNLIVKDETHFFTESGESLTVDKVEIFK